MRLCVRWRHRYLSNTDVVSKQARGRSYCKCDKSDRPRRPAMPMPCSPSCARSASDERKACCKSVSASRHATALPRLGPCIERKRTRSLRASSDYARRPLVISLPQPLLAFLSRMMVRDEPVRPTPARPAFYSSVAQALVARVMNVERVADPLKGWIALLSTGCPSTRYMKRKACSSVRNATWIEVAY